MQKYNAALVSGEDPAYHLNGFIQFMFDNVDLNVATLTGHN